MIGTIYAAGLAIFGIIGLILWMREVRRGLDFGTSMGLILLGAFLVMFWPAVAICAVMLGTFWLLYSLARIGIK